MKRIGLTGSIGSGKSAAVTWLRAQGIAVHDADAAVHEIYTRPETLAWLQANFPESMKDGAVDKNQLALTIFSNVAARTKLENHIHAHVLADRMKFIAAADARGESMVVCDIPLLFETGAEKEFDETWLLTAPYDIRYERVLARPGMSDEKFILINAAQMPQDEKEKRATHVIENNGTLHELQEKLACLIGQK